MGNIIYSDANAYSEPLIMSNGTTSVLVAVLALAGADIATNDWERDVLSWIATNDQSIFGIGCVGFDIAELGWANASFNTQKQFLLNLVERGRSHIGWQRLDYDPDENIANAMLSKLELLITGFDISHCHDQPLKWKLPATGQSTRCSIHGIYQHGEGCVICNDT